MPEISGKERLTFSPHYRPLRQSLRENIFWGILEGFCTLEISGKERLFHGITGQIPNFSKLIISEYFPCK